MSYYGTWSQRPTEYNQQSFCQCKQYRAARRVIYCTQPPHAEVTKLLCPHHEDAGSPHPVRVGGPESPDLWYQVALVDTTVEQSLVSSAGTRGRECVRVEDGTDGSPRGG